MCRQLPSFRALFGEFATCAACVPCRTRCSLAVHSFSPACPLICVSSFFPFFFSFPLRLALLSVCPSWHAFSSHDSKPTSDRCCLSSRHCDGNTTFRVVATTSFSAFAFVSTCLQQLQFAHCSDKFAYGCVATSWSCSCTQTSQNKEHARDQVAHRRSKPTESPQDCAYLVLLLICSCSSSVPIQFKSTVALSSIVFFSCISFGLLSTRIFTSSMSCRITKRCSNGRSFDCTARRLDAVEGEQHGHKSVSPVLHPRPRQPRARFHDGFPTNTKMVVRDTGGRKGESNTVNVQCNPSHIIRARLRRAVTTPITLLVAIVVVWA